MDRRQSERLERWCGRRSVELVSFDVFDTLLTRPVVAPADLFTAVGRRASVRLGRQCEPGDAETFAALRVQAEQLARKSSTTEETSLDSIWEILERLIGWEGLRFTSACELEVEAESLTVVQDTADLVEGCRRKGKRLAFVSDTYLPEAFVRDQLEAHGLYRAGDVLYVSSTNGKTKATGSLFDEMLLDTGIPASGVVHIGDHPQSDVQMPRRRGIASQRTGAADLTADEWDLYRRLEPRRDPASRIPGAARAFRVARRRAEQNDEAALVAELLGPAIMIFVVWALGEASRLGLERLYFCARDGYLPWRMAARLTPHFGGVECRYLHVSRRALYLPSVQAVTPEEMPWLRKWYERISLRQALAKLDEHVDDFAGVSPEAANLAKTPDSVLDDSAWESFWKTLRSDPMRQTILDKARTQREAALGYFREQGLFLDYSWAIVDVGWHLSCQAALRKIFRSADPQADVRGLYLGLRDERAPPTVAGPAQAMCYGPGQNVPRHDRTGALFGMTTAWEHLFGCAPHGGVRRYVKYGDGDGREYAPDCSDDSHARASAIASLVEEYAESNLKLAESLLHAGPLGEIALEVFAKAATSPSLAISRLANRWFSSRDEADFSRSPLAQPYAFNEALAGALPSVFGRLGLKPKDREWPAASRRLSSLPSRAVFALLTHLKEVVRGAG
jgi:FMN phosphatase YigB (HAD superfamily)